MKLIRNENNVELQRELAERLRKVQWHDNHRYASACCPYHQETHPSFFLYPDYFKCSSCGEQGSLQKLEKKLYGKREVVEEFNYDYAPFKTWWRKHKSWEDAAIYAYQTGKQFPPLMSYFHKRKLGQFVQQGCFGWIDGWFSIPVFDEEGYMVDWLVRSHPSKNTELRYAIRPRENSDDMHLYCPDWTRLEADDTVYVPFGIMDVWSVYATGVASITGLTGQDYKPHLFDKIRKRIIILPDANEIDGARKLQRALGWRGEVKMLDYPEGTKDSNEILVKYGLETLKNLILN